jgi:hypothetical protein
VSVVTKPRRDIGAFDVGTRDRAALGVPTD